MNEILLSLPLGCERYVLKYHDTMYVSETAESYSYDDIAKKPGGLVLSPNPKDNNLFSTHTAEKWAFLWHLYFEESSLGQYKMILTVR